MMRQKLRASYDELADVLYISLGEPVPSEGDGVPNGIELDFTLDSGIPCGATVIGFRQYEWHNYLEQLGAIIARHLGMRGLDVESAVQSAVRATGPNDARPYQRRG